ncbi:MAG: RNA polymerase sigma factor [Labilithrix sp.]|nr:RNA polymerase sigma factor [Labilithrix sp.]
MAEARGELDLRRELEALHAASFGWALACAARERDEAADVLQEVYWKVLSGRARYGGRSSFKTWLFGVIRLTAIEQRRFRFARRREIPTADTTDVADVPAPSGPLVDRRTAEAISRALGALSEKQREVLHLVFYEGLSIAEASEVMGVSLGTARLHYERGKAHMLAILTKEGVTL